MLSLTRSTRMRLAPALGIFRTVAHWHAHATRRLPLNRLPSSVHTHAQVQRVSVVARIQRHCFGRRHFVHGHAECFSRSRGERWCERSASNTRAQLATGRPSQYARRPWPFRHQRVVRITVQPHDGVRRVGVWCPTLWAKRRQHGTVLAQVDCRLEPRAARQRVQGVGRETVVAHKKHIKGVISQRKAHLCCWVAGPV
jgi:hypothetical protein